MNELLELVGNLQECPWAKWAPATLRFCEAHVCERIVAPAETWSNLAYFGVALALFLQTRRFTDLPRRDLTFRFGIYAAIIGVCSALFHASYSYAFETADLAAMNLLGIEMVFQALRALGWARRSPPLVFGAVVFAGALMLLLGTAGTDRLFVFGAFAAVSVWLECLIYVRARRRGIRGDYRAFVGSLVLFVVALAFWASDFIAGGCVPDRHWYSGHAAWHVINAGCFLTLSAFYRTRYA